jgi:hypothetical protein
MILTMKAPVKKTPTGNVKGSGVQKRSEEAATCTWLLSSFSSVLSN